MINREFRFYSQLNGMISQERDNEWERPDVLAGPE